MSELKVIYLGPACQENGDGREWCQDDVWQPCECGHTSVKFVASTELDRVTAERDGLQLALNTADQTIDDLQVAIRRRNQRIDELERGEKAPLDPPQPITEQFIEDHLGKMPYQLSEAAKMIGIERMPPMEYDEP